MSSVVLDAGALIAVERRDRHVMADLEVARRRGIPLVTHSGTADPIDAVVALLARQET